MMLEIQNLSVSIDETPILRDFTLTVKKGEIHAVMGPNGAGKSTLAKVLAGDPHYTVTGGTITFLGQDLLELDIAERSHVGLFVGFQYPVEISGVTNREFLLNALNAQRKSQAKNPITEEAFHLLLLKKMKEIGMDPQFGDRNVNEGFSGGEKKRNEILQLAVLNPTLAILDETDSGLDIDAMRIVAKGINQQLSPEKSLILITHYKRLLDYISPDFVHVMREGKIVETGGKDLALKLEEKGYQVTS